MTIVCRDSLVAILIKISTGQTRQPTTVPDDTSSQKISEM